MLYGRLWGYNNICQVFKSQNFTHYCTLLLEYLFRRFVYLIPSKRDQFRTKNRNIHILVWSSQNVRENPAGLIVGLLFIRVHFSQEVQVYLFINLVRRFYRDCLMCVFPLSAVQL